MLMKIFMVLSYWDCFFFRIEIANALIKEENTIKLEG